LDIVDERADMMVKIGETLRMAALSGLSIIMQPEILLAEDLKNGNLRALLSNFAPEPKFVPFSPCQAGNKRRKSAPLLTFYGHVFQCVKRGKAIVSFRVTRIQCKMRPYLRG
jgi:DNA-binding transcriptional LysR family regulator